ncbi:MAG: CDP-alcohol phosphatidyltransferase family protein [Methyloligellaceae bacterium]
MKHFCAGAAVPNVMCRNGMLRADIVGWTMPAWVLGAAVHVLTASGAVCGLLALHYAAERDWQLVFLWLGVALIIDGIDGPLARRFDTAAALPRFSGVRLDLVVDYLNYCAVPAFILTQAQLVPAGLELVAGAIILLSSLFHFADRNSKTEEGYFIGFPALWNIVVFYIIALGLAPLWAFLLILGLSVATFAPFRWLHPIRVRSLRPVTLFVLMAWSVSAISVIVEGFPATPAVKTILITTFVYAVTVSGVTEVRSRLARR